MEIHPFKVGETVVVTETVGDLIAGTIATIADVGGCPPRLMKNRPNWAYFVELSDGTRFSVNHQHLKYASRELKVKKLRQQLEELTSLRQAVADEADMLESFKDEADFVTSKICEVILIDAPKNNPLKLISSETKEKIRKLIASKFPSSTYLFDK